MEKAKRIFTLTLAAVMLAVSSGFALHSMRCLMTGKTHHSMVVAKCCCSNDNARAEEVNSNCCDELTVALKQDIEALQPTASIQINPVFFTAFLTNFLATSHAYRLLAAHTHYLKSPLSSPGRDILLFGQSFRL